MTKLITIGIVGGGNMGEAFIKSVHAKYSVVVHEKDQERQEYLRKTYKIRVLSLKDLLEASEVIILAVKPQDIEEVLSAIRPFVNKNKLIISIAAGITISYLEKSLPEKTRVIRAMPNMPAMIEEGITALCKGNSAKSTDLDLAVKILNHLGEVVSVSEDLIDAVTAVSGSGPAYVFLFMECLMKAAQSLGLNEKLSKQLVEATFKGSVDLLTMKNEDPAVLRAKVTSKGGTTQAAMDVFIEKKIDSIIQEALGAAKKRAGELSRK